MKVVLATILVYLVAAAKENYAKEVDERVFNGYNANYGQFPFQAFLSSSKEDGSNLVWLCGGSLISSRHILTAAHCLKDMVSSQVKLGVTDLQDNRGTANYYVGRNQMAIHPNYDPNTFNNDVGLMLLPQAVTFTDYIRPVNLPSRSWANPSTFDNYYVTVSGFGLAYNNDQTPHRILQYRTVLMMPHYSCANYGLQPPITYGMLCTDRRINSGHCQGDSGGPLTVSLNTGLFLVGVVSWGGRPCVNDRPSVYANVANYLDWINRMTGIPIN